MARGVIPRMNEEISAELQERFAAIRSKAVAAGVRFVSEDRRREDRRREEWRLECRAKGAKAAKGERRRVKQGERQMVSGSGAKAYVNKGFLAASEDDFTAQDQARLEAMDHEAPEPAPEGVAAARGTAQRAIPISRGERQEAFEASGKGDSANARLITFFDQAIETGQVGHWFSRHALKEFCRNDMVHNRVDDLRPMYAERGVKIINGQVSPNGVRPKASHYRLLLMSDREVAEFERTKIPPTA